MRLSIALYCLQILPAAHEYTKFIISTVQNSYEAKQGDGLGRISLRTSNYWTHFMYLDRFESRQPENDEEKQWRFELEGYVIVPTVISGWNIMQYLATEVEQEIFRGIAGRFSKDVHNKQMEIDKKLVNKKGIDLDSEKVNETFSPKAELLNHTKNLVSNQYSIYLTRAVGEILKDGRVPDSFPKLPGCHLNLTRPALEFVKNVIEVLEIDSEVDQ